MEKKLFILPISLFLLFSAELKAQAVTAAQKERLEQLFKKDSVVKFTFTVHSTQEIAPLSRIVTVDKVNNTLVSAHANKDQFSKFIVKNYSYQVEEPVKKPVPKTEVSVRGLPPEKQQKLDELFKTQNMVRFSFSVQSLQEICSLSSIIDIDETKGLRVTAHATKDQFGDFLMKNYEYTLPPAKKTTATSKPKAKPKPKATGTKKK